MAMGILVSEISGSRKELQFLRHFMNVAPEGSRYIRQLITELEHYGPNGVHKCLIFELVSLSISSMVKELP